MADGAGLSFANLGDYTAELRALPQVLQTRVMRGATATMASVVRKASIAKAPEWTGPVGKGHPLPGTLKKSIYQARMTELCTATVEVFKVDVRGGNKTSKGGKVTQGAYYAGMVERGHFTRGSKAPGGTKKSRRQLQIDFGQVRWVAAQPFMRPAFDANQQAALDAGAEYIRTNLAAATSAMRYIQAIGS